ncbi:MAG: redoxin family protein [Caulobacterales bacterium]|nr:redoxin family protein [Caulobacterales bacterium]
MTLLLLAYLGGVLTIVSPCVLPVLPFVFARADRPFLRNGLPMLAGMAITFAGVATLASVAGGWAVQANTAGRYIALALLALFAITLLFPGLADRLTRPLVALGGRLSQSADDGQVRGGVGASLLLGVATGLLWAPCAGPILGLILTGAALQGANTQTALLLLVYAAGAATSLALALLVGGKVFAAMKRSLHASEWIRRGLGAAVLVAVAAIALGLDTGLLTRVSLAGTTALEQGLLSKLNPEKPAPQQGQAMMSGPAMSGGAMTGPAMSGGGAMMAGPSMMGGAPAMSGGAMMAGPAMSGGAVAPMETLPSLAGATGWLNSPALTPQALKGKVVLVDFWTYSCINCLRALPYVKRWSERYGSQGLVVIGVHTPEFAFEKREANVRKAVKDLGLAYPVALDNDYGVWRAFNNNSWPAHYFFDAEGNLRYQHVGEGEYDRSEAMIRALLAERNGAPVDGDLVGAAGQGVQAAASDAAVSPETYLGYARAERFLSPAGLKNDASATYRTPMAYPLNTWAFAGPWRVGSEQATSGGAGARVIYRFRARDLHMVLGSVDGKPVRFRIRVDGRAPGADHGLDVNAAGEGTVSDQRLYQLVRQRGASAERLFEIEFLGAGAQAFTFTFG